MASTGSHNRKIRLLHFSHDALMLCQRTLNPRTLYTLAQGARVASQCASDNADKVPGVVLSSYPLHPPGKQVGLSA